MKQKAKTYKGKRIVIGDKNLVTKHEIHVNDIPQEGGESGGGGGVTINNQEKSVDITENGTTEVVADAGFTGLSKVVVNTNVPTGGGGGDSWTGEYFPTIGDGSTYFYINVTDMLSPDIYLRFTQSKEYGVQVDMGDGSEIKTFAGSSVTLNYSYLKPGLYRMSLTPSDDCTLSFGTGSYGESTFGNSSLNTRAYAQRAKVIQAEFGKNLRCKDYSFCEMLLLKKVIFTPYEIEFGSSVFQNCTALEIASLPITSSSYSSIFNSSKGIKQLNINEGVKVINGGTLYSCPCVTRVSFPKNIETIKGSAFQYVSCVKAFDFSRHEFVPTLENSNAFQTGYAPTYDNSGRIIVPDMLYDEWIAATNWSEKAIYIIKKSDWDTLNA